MGHHATEWHVNSQPRGGPTGSVCRGEGRHRIGKVYAADYFGDVSSNGVDLMLAIANLYKILMEIYRSACLWLW